MPSLLSAYLPYYVRAALIQHPERSPLTQAQRFDAVVLFADVSGFTAISEALGASGKTGTEELTRILNGYFEPMIGLIHTYGGMIGKFGGDAMTVVFPCAGSLRDDPGAAQCALHCALEMQARMTQYAALQTSAGTFSLAMKAGIAGGPVFAATVGDPALRLEHILAGSALDRCAEAEHHAVKGEVVIERALLPLTPGAEVAEERGDYARVIHLPPPAACTPFTSLPVPAPAALDTMAAYIHPAIAQRLREGQASFINEHRKVTVLFVAFANLDYDHDPEVGQKLQAYLSRVFEIVARYDGYVNKVDMGDKGSKYIVLFGAPIAHENDPERALRCALELRALPDTLARIGVNSGYVFCGQVGAPDRQEYTVMGDAVNLAARLMQAAAPGQILVSAATHAAGGKAFTSETLPPLHVKGKTEPVGCHSLTDVRRESRMHLQEPQYALPMVGRGAELRQAEAGIARALQGQGQIIGVTAEAGMGKSRLAAEVIRLANARGLEGYAGECLSHATTTSYHVWRNLLRGLFALNPDTPPEEQAQQLHASLAAMDPVAALRVPLLGAALNLNLPDNDVTGALDAKLRKASLEALIAEYIRYRAGQMPLLLVLEDCHWIDPLSNDLLEVVGRAISDAPVLLLIVYRPAQREAIQPSVTQFAHFTCIPLEEFTAAEAAQLIELKLGQWLGAETNAPPALIERITARAEGNPFYIDEMINLIRDRHIDPTDAAALETLELPDSLHSLIISRIDRLSEAAKSTVKVASVIGRLFRASWLWGIYPALGTPEHVRAQLEQLSQLDITPLDKPEPELEYLFKHIITREVAYESLAVATRAMLHEQTGLFIEREFPGEQEHYLDLLAYHYGLSHNEDKQREYFARAGQVAQAAYANQAAITYYRRLLPLLEDAAKDEIRLKLGEILQLTGSWDEAEALFRAALSSAEERRVGPKIGLCMRMLGSLLRQKGDYETAVEYLEEAQRFQAIDDWGNVIETLREIGIVYWSQGNLPAARASFEQVQQIARNTKDNSRLARILNNLGLVHYRLLEYKIALEHFREGYKLSYSLNDRLTASSILLNTGNVHLDLGQYPEALTHYAQSLNMAQEIGYQLSVSINVGNMGRVYLDQGENANAGDCYAYNLYLSMQLGDLFGVSFALWNIAIAAMNQRRYREAGRLLYRAATLARLIDIPYELSAYLLTHAQLYTRQQNYAAARPLNAEALDIAAQMGFDDILFKARVLAFELEILLGETSCAESCENIAALLSPELDERQRALIHYTLGRLGPDQEAHRVQAADLYRALYVTSPEVEFKRRYEELTGETLPNPPPLPPLPEIVTRQTFDIEQLIRQADALITEMEARERPAH